MAKPLLHSHQRAEEEKKTLHLVQSHRLLVCFWMCESVCVCTHLSACVYELFVSPPQALGCWVCSLKRLCFCCHLSLPVPVFLPHIQTLPASLFFCLCLYHAPSPSCTSVCHYRCFIAIVFKGTRQNKCQRITSSHPAQGMTLCLLRAKLVRAGSFENIIKLFMQ